MTDSLTDDGPSESASSDRDWLSDGDSGRVDGAAPESGSAAAGSAPGPLTSRRTVGRRLAPGRAGGAGGAGGTGQLNYN